METSVRRRNVASDAMAFWRRVVAKRGLTHAVSVTENGETVIKIADELPYLPFLKRRGRPRFVVTMEGLLSTAHFGRSSIDGNPTAKGQINRRRHKDRGRVVFLVVVDAHGREEEIAALSFHVDEARAAPVMLSAVALRTDSTANNDLSRAGAAWLLAYLVEASRQARDKEEVGADEGRMGDPVLVHSLGFRPGPNPRDLDLIGRYLVFRPPFSTATGEGSQPSSSPR